MTVLFVPFQLVYVISLSFPAVLAGASKKILKRNSHPGLISHRKENDFNISLLHVIYVGDTLCQIREVSFSSHSHISLMNEC